MVSRLRGLPDDRGVESKPLFGAGHPQSRIFGKRPNRYVPNGWAVKEPIVPRAISSTSKVDFPRLVYSAGLSANARRDAR
jgi:hypothetical protein